jgi:flagellar operon protein
MTVRQLASRVEAGRADLPRGKPDPAQNVQQGQPTFAEALRRTREGLATTQSADIQLSAHAQQRMEQRGISFNDAERASVIEAMQVLEQKGARDALLLRADAAFLVNVPNRTVVTAVNHQEMQQRAFTQIDSALLL